MLLVGIGNRMRGDDAVGPVVADRVAALGLAGVVVATDPEPLALLDRLQDGTRHEHVVVVDATAPLGRPGRLRVLREADGAWSLPSPPVGSHDLGLAGVLALARTLALLPPYLTVVGVEGQDLALGAGLTAPVQEGVDAAVAVVAELAAVAAGPA